MSSPGSDPQHPDSSEEKTLRREPARSSSVSEPPVSMPSASLQGEGFAARYETLDVLGEGAMGMVHLTRDRRIGRDVAVKSILPAQASREDVRARFLREARIQGQLEHPGVVPVHDLGIGGHGETFFAMKRIVGLTLEEILDRLGEGDPQLAHKFTRHKLLSAFASVCLTVEFAHTRGVIHRDLKPANIMLGEFGEVNVLDWGVAKISGDPDAPRRARDAPIPEPKKTVDGSVIGTPGYMSPEQTRGDTVDRRTDIYALGAILYEILTLHPLQPSDDIAVMLFRSMQGVDARPSKAHPEANVPPELEAICVRAAAKDPENRFQSARELSEALERYLDGDRDLERRRELAREHLDIARAALRPANWASVDRPQAIRELQLAMALDPENRDAMNLLMQMLGDTPKQMPPEAEAELEESIERLRRKNARATTVAYLSILLVYPFLFWAGIRSVAATLGVTVVILGAAAYTAWFAGKKGSVTRGYQMISIAVAATVVAASTVLFGPLILLPTFAAATALVFIVQMRADRPLRHLMVGACVAAVIGPTALQAAGVLPASYQFEGSTMVVLPWLANLSPAPTLLLLLTASVQALIVPGVLVGRAVERLIAAERHLFMHAWNLRQLVPDQARVAPLAPRTAHPDQTA